jgi:protein PsiE
MRDDEPHRPGGFDSDEPGAAPSPVAKAIHSLMLFLEQLFLITVAGLTIVVAYLDFRAMLATGSVQLADILLLFLYAEVVAMVAVFFSRSGSLFTFPIFIAITALARLMVIEGKEIQPQNFMFHAGAILLLAFAVAVLSWARRS